MVPVQLVYRLCKLLHIQWNLSTPNSLVTCFCVRTVHSHWWYNNHITTMHAVHSHWWYNNHIIKMHTVHSHWWYNNHIIKMHALHSHLWYNNHIIKMHAVHSHLWYNNHIIYISRTIKLKFQWYFYLKYCHFVP
jgi:hypothetical protein